MKQLPLIIAFSTFTLIAFSQPVLTNTYNPGIGVTHNRIICDPAGVTPGPSGAAQTWTFTLTPTAAQLNESFVDPASTPQSSQFPTANLARLTNPNNNYSYYEATASSLVYIGQSNDFQTNVYTDPITELVYPMTFGDSIVDTYGFGIPPADGSMSGVEKVYYDGYGTLTVNGATFNNVIRIYNVKDDTSYLGGNEIPFHGVYYQWIDPNAAASVLLQITQAAGTQIVIVADEVLSVNENLSKGNLFNIFPSVADGSGATLQYSLVKPGRLTIEVCNNLGELMSVAKMPSQQNGSLFIDTNSFASGLFFVNIKDIDTGELLDTKRLILQR